MKRTYTEVLFDFSSVKMPLAYLLDLIPCMRPRSFSIASAPIAHSGRIHLTVGLVSYKTKLTDPRTGICSQWMKSWDVGDPILFRIGPGTMDIKTNGAICIGPGTGIAPIRSILYSLFPTSSPLLLFTGSRYRDKDYLYGTEWIEKVKEGRLSHYPSFSRDQNTKEYVQDTIRKHGTQVWEMLSNGARIYISGY